ncbi:SLC13 family permease [Methanofollis fontis]|uniref:SLC13 family permease n=1 Tax=Methanofollis fontis TaxID=2052832 RepID=A0A483CWM3_9EURY|nr:SLC13 family permease [Methanofollis fontis]TAJ44076.1 SLC13 family permease [Methanofollis fontis]
METEIILMLLVLGVTVLLFITEAIRVDVVALLVLVMLFWFGLVTPVEAFSGFASNAVIAVISIMILGRGIERTGIMGRLSRSIVGVAGTDEKRLLATFSAVVGGLSAFMQNIGSVALFLPALMRISKRTKIPPSRLVMPMGFSAILGGTLTMIGSSALIIQNDLLAASGLEPFGFFAVTPVGLILLVSGILYFLLLGDYVLPGGRPEGRRPGSQEDLVETWQLPTGMHHYHIPPDSSLNGKEREEVRLKAEYALHLLAITDKRDVFYAPWRHTPLRAGQSITLLGKTEDAARFASDFSLVRRPDQARLSAEVGGENAGFAEVLVRPHAPLAGKSLREITFRKTYGVEPILLSSRDAEMRMDFFDVPLSAGDIIVVFGPWNNIRALAGDPSFVLSTPVDEPAVQKEKAPIALLCFIGGIALTLTGIPIAMGLLTGALAMILTGVLGIDEAYRSIDWKTVFLLAGLIPLGIAMINTGTASLIAASLLSLIGGAHPVLLFIGIGALTTIFTLFMSNMGAVVILVPIVLLVGAETGIDPRGLALLVGISASNSFILPTHQVNAFLMSPGGYHNRDYLKAGGILTILYLIIVSGWIYLVFV